MNGTLRERFTDAILTAVDCKPDDLNDEDRVLMARLCDALAEVAASEIRGLANNLPQPAAPQPSEDASETTWLLAAEWETGFKAGRDAAHDLLIERCSELRGTAPVTS
jgi:hypothetical protein